MARIVVRRNRCPGRLEQRAVPNRSVTDVKPSGLGRDLLGPQTDRARIEREDLPSAGIDERHGAFGTGGQGVERRDARHGNIQSEREGTRGNEAHPQARVAPRPGADDDAVELAASGTGLLSNRSTSESSAGTEVRPSASASPSLHTAQVAVSVAVSNERISTVEDIDVLQGVPVSLDGEETSIAAEVSEPNVDRRGRQVRPAGIRPLDEHDRVVEVRLQIPPLRFGHAVEPVQIEVGDRHPPT